MERKTEVEITDFPEDAFVQFDLVYEEATVHVEFTGFGNHNELVIRAMRELGSQETLLQVYEGLR